MKTKLNYTKLLIETVILTVAVAIIAAAVYFFHIRWDRQSRRLRPRESAGLNHSEQ